MLSILLFIIFIIVGLILLDNVLAASGKEIPVFSGIWRPFIAQRKSGRGEESQNVDSQHFDDDEQYVMTMEDFEEPEELPGDEKMVIHVH